MFPRRKIYLPFTFSSFIWCFSSLKALNQVYYHTPNINTKVGVNGQIVRFVHMFLSGRKKGLWIRVLNWNKGCQVNDKTFLPRAFGGIKCIPGEEKCFSHKLLVRHVPLKLTKWWKWAGANVEKEIFFLIWKLRCSVRLKGFFNFYNMSW